MRIENLGQQPQRILTQRAERILDVPARLLARTGDRPLNQPDTFTKFETIQFRRRNGGKIASRDASNTFRKFVINYFHFVLLEHRRPLVDAIGMKRVVTRRQWADEILRFEPDELFDKILNS